MRNLAQISEIVKDDAFGESLIALNREALDYYNKELGFDEFKRTLKSASELSESQLIKAIVSFFSFDRIRHLIRKESEMDGRVNLYSSVFQPITGSFFSGVVLAQTDRFTAMLLAINHHDMAIGKRRSEGEKRTISFAGLPAYVHFYRAHGVKLKFWRLPPFGDTDDLADMSLHPSIVGEQTMQDGEGVLIGATDSFEYLAATGPALILQIQLHGDTVKTTLEFDVDDLRLVGASASSQEPTRLQMLATTVRLFGRSDGMEELEKLLSHGSHHVRWHVMREILGLDAKRGLPLLQQLSIMDAQPAVRRAATRTLEMFFPDSVNQIDA